MQHTKRDFPRLRAFNVCPLCSGAKPRGALSCWQCWNSRQPDCDDDPYFWRRCERAELALESAGTILASKLRSVLDGDDELHARNIRHHHLMKG